MTLPSTPFWALAHIAVKFPLITLVAASAYFLYPEQNTRMVAITFDDGRKSVLEVALPYMKEKNVVGTTYLNVDALSFPDYSGEEDVTKFIGAGWEIGSHGFSHTDMTTLSAEQLFESFESSKRILQELSGQTITSFASPYGAFNELTIQQVSKFYENHVNAVNGWNEERGLNYAESFDPLNIHRIDITSEVNSVVVCNRIASLPENTLYVLLFHNITDDEGKFNTKPQTFKEIVDCVADASVDTVTITEATNRMLE